MRFKYGRRLAATLGRTYIFAGPAFVNERYPDQPVQLIRIGESGVAVPTHFFRIHAALINGRLEAIGFLVPNTSQVEGGPDRFVVTVRRIEQVTGLEFFRYFIPSERERISLEVSRELRQLIGEPKVQS